MNDEKIVAEKLWKFAWTYIKTVVDTLREPFLILDDNMRVLSANKTFYKLFRTTPGNTELKKIYKLGNGQWDIPKLRTLLESILPENTYFKDFKVEHDFPEIGHKILLLNARRVHREHEGKPIILLAMEDVTKQETLKTQLRQHSKVLATEVAQRTSELEAKVKELERLNKIMVGRELKMVELKREIHVLKKSK